MQIRASMHRHFVRLRRLFYDPVSPHGDKLHADASPVLMYAAIVLTLLVAIFEVDLHRPTLEAIGLLRGDRSTDLENLSLLGDRDARSASSCSRSSLGSKPQPV